MSLAIAHFAVGAVCMALVLTAAPPVPFQRSLVVLGGIWAMVPDGWRFLPTHSGAYAHDFHASGWANLFWFHNALDRADVGDSTGTGALLVAVFFGVTVLAEYRDYRTPEPVREIAPDAIYGADD
ncbi:MAG: hypothetical protein ABEJ40_00155 [Haloarculaceae archaeon]